MFKIIKPGFLTTVQDAGRPGYRHIGVPVSGALDQMAYRAANILAGNESGAAALEMTLAGPEIVFLNDCAAAVTGADMEPRLSGKAVPMWERIYCRAGDMLCFGYRKKGCRSYLAVSGGINVPPVLGSRSTYLTAGFGGYNGRRLKKNDILKLLPEESENTLAGCVVPLKDRPVYSSEVMVRVIRGINAGFFSDKEYKKLFTVPFKVTQRLDRMGCCLEGGTPIVSDKQGLMLSCPATPGSIQVPPSGQPVVLLQDAQATGGYPQIGCVISADLWKLGQVVPGDTVFFEETDIKTAHEIIKELSLLNIQNQE